MRENRTYGSYGEGLETGRLTPIPRQSFTRQLLFLEAKKAYSLDVLPSTKPEVVEALVYVGILTLIVSRRILSTIRRRHPDKAHRMTNLRWAEVHAATAHKTLEKVLAHVGLHIDDFEYIDLLSGQAFDPNDDRDRLSDRWLA